MKAEMLQVRLSQKGNSICLSIPFISDRVFEIVRDGLVSNCVVSFESSFESEV